MVNPFRVLSFCLMTLAIMLTAVLPGCASPDVSEQEMSVVVRTNGTITLELGFVHPIVTGVASERRDWTREDMAPILNVADRWLTIVTGVEGGAEGHTITVTIRAEFEEGVNGSAGVELLEEVKPDVYLPRYADLLISGDIFSASWSEPGVLEHTVLHEFAHIFGIGTAFYVFEHDGYYFSGAYPVPDDWPYRAVRDWLNEQIPESSGRIGRVYRQPHGVAAYNEVYGAELDFLPMSPDGGHLFTVDYDPAARKIIRTPWRVTGHTPIQPMEAELMGHGDVLSKITLAMLKDLGWQVDDSRAEPFSTN